MKIIFLDVDGVLNTSNNILKEYKNDNDTTSSRIHLDRDCVNNLKEIVDRTNAQLVLSSSWRKSGFYSTTLKNLEYQLNSNGMILLDCTPILWDATRGTEIKEWLKSKSKIYKIESYVILDDEEDMDDLIDHLVKTTYDDGLTHDLINIACDILNKKETTNDQISYIN